MKSVSFLTILAVGALAAGCGSHSRAPEGATSGPASKAVQTSSATPSPDGKDLSEYCRVCFVQTMHVMPPKPGAAYKVSKDGREYHFCSDWCRDEFKKHPEKYVLKL